MAISLQCGFFSIPAQVVEKGRSMRGGRRQLIWRVVPLLGLVVAVGVSMLAGASLSPALSAALSAVELIV